MILVVHELKTELKQQVSIDDKDFILSGIRPHLVKTGNPGGSLQMEIEDTSNRLIGNSEIIPISAITPAAYFHGYVRFYCNVPLKKNTNYFVSLKGVGYSFSESAYIGWANDYDLRRTPLDYVPVSDIEAPLDLELWTKNKTIRRGR